MATLNSHNPLDNSIVGSVDVTPTASIPSLVQRAREAQPAWAALSFEERAVLLRRAGEEFVKRAEDAARIATKEMGKPFKQMHGEAKYTASSFADHIDEFAEAFAPLVHEGRRTRSTTYKDPLGVVVCITPWNFPLLMPHQQILPALAAGNTVLFKPSEKTPLVGQAYADVLLEVLPEGVLTVVHGDGEQGRALVQADVDLIVFTGSLAAGEHILAAAAPDMKRVLLELGGKDPLIVLGDADLPAAAAFAARNSFRNSGQVCVSTERIYVDADSHDTFVALLVDEAAKLTLGDGLQDGIDLGPMVDGTQKAHVLSQLAAARTAGATFAFEGEDKGGNFVAPTVLTDVDESMPILTEETFGPVVAVVRVSSDEEAIRRANDSRYGLGAVVFGESKHASEVARHLDAGMIGVNQGLGGEGPTPWVGAKKSGHGFHSSRDGHVQFTQIRVIHEKM